MNTAEFNKVLDQTLENVKNVMGSKSKEYSTADNKLHNFDEGARITGQTREKVLHGFALKHHISINDIRNGIEEGKLPTLEMLDEKYGDAINYLILEKASIIDRIQKREREPLIKTTQHIRGLEVQAEPLGNCCLGGEIEGACRMCPDN